MPDDAGSPGAAVSRRADIERAADDIADDALREVMRQVRAEASRPGAFITIALLLALWGDATKAAIDRRARRLDPRTADLLAVNLTAEDMPLAVPADLYQTITDLQALAAANAWSDAARRDGIRRALTIATAAALAAPAITGLGINPNDRDLFGEPIPGPDAMAAVLSARAAAWRDRLRVQALAAATATNSVLTVEAITFGGYRNKMWQSMRDDRVRHAHVEADGMITAPNQPFIVGGEAMMYPGDRTASIGLWINCRCLLLGTNRG